MTTTRATLLPSAVLDRALLGRALHFCALAVCALAICALLPACASSGGSTEKPVGVDQLGPDGPEPFNPELSADKRRAGAVLTALSQKIKIWNDLILSGDTSKDSSTYKTIDSAIRYEASKKVALLIDQLQTGPKFNRQRAATALGFAATPDALGPLLVALDDEDEDVVANALLGLAVLQSPATPAVRLAGLMSDRERSRQVRNNAGEALNSIPIRLTDNARDVVMEAARFAIGDELPSVRMQGAILLARTGDYESIGDLAVLLDDAYPGVTRASSRAIAYLGDTEPRVFGEAARALVMGWKRTKGNSLKKSIMLDLQKLSNRNYDDYEDWLKWATGLN